MYKKLLILSLGALAVSPAFAAITVTSIETDLNGVAKANAVTNSYASNLFTGYDYQGTSSTNGVAYSQAYGYASAGQSGQTVSAYNYAVSDSQSLYGVGSASATATTYVKIKFTLDVASNVSYNVWAEGYGYGVTKNKASASFNYDGWAGSGPLPTAGLGDNLTGSMLLGAGNYVVELYTSAKTSAKSNSATSWAYSHADNESGLTFTAQAVPEPASMAVLAVGAVALLRRRKKA